MDHRIRTLIPSALLAQLTLLAGPAAAYDPTIQVVPVGDPAVSGTSLPAYEFEWAQYQRGPGTLSEPSATYRETFEREELDGRYVWVHQQWMDTGRGFSAHATTVLDRRSLAPISMVRELEGHPQGLSHVELRFDETGYTKRSQRGEFDRSSRVELATPSFDGAIFGIAIAGLPLAEGLRVRMPTVFTAWDGLYWLELSVTGRREVDWQGRTFEVLLVDADWLNVNDGSIYPGGPDLSGGRYEILAPEHREEGSGLPLVWRYVNDTGDIRPVGWTPPD